LRNWKLKLFLKSTSNRSFSISSRLSKGGISSSLGGFWGIGGSRLIANLGFGVVLIWLSKLPLLVWEMITSLPRGAHNEY
jgi:hypothetical protein